MKTILDAEVRQEVIHRLEKLNPQSTALWGQMTVEQMLRHLRLWEEMIHENKRYPRPFIGRLIGSLIMKQVLSKPELPKATPTIPEMRISDKDIDLADERSKLKELIAHYATYDVPDYTFVHHFFGKMTKAQIGRMAYMHLDHHLRQFGE
jgi:hypothetical protein